MATVPIDADGKVQPMICRAESLSDEQKVVVEGLLGREVRVGDAISVRLMTQTAAPEWMEESWKSAEELGLDRMTMDEIDAEIAAARAERRARR
jgi:hypothetical protein